MPSDDGRAVGYELKALVEATFTPDPFFYHLAEGGHVAAIHIHRRQKYFSRLDFASFFYSIARNRVARALREIGLARAESEYYAKWSCVKNPYERPSYALPYGFVQSPLLASLVLASSEVGTFLRGLPERIVVSVYGDDIALSGNNRRVLQRVHRELRRVAVTSNFTVNEAKSIELGETVELFNCDLSHQNTIVTDARRKEFYSVAKSTASETAFENYCAAIALGNEPDASRLPSRRP